MEYYSLKSLGASGTDLAGISWFFARPYDTPVETLGPAVQSWVLSVAATCLRAQGRLAEALLAERAGLQMDEVAKDWANRRWRRRLCYVHMGSDAHRLDAGGY